MIEMARLLHLMPTYRTLWMIRCRTEFHFRRLTRLRQPLLVTTVTKFRILWPMALYYCFLAYYRLVGQDQYQVATPPRNYEPPTQYVFWIDDDLT
jgi:hypothetical protein